MSGADLGFASDAIVDAGVVRRIREGDRVVLEAPTRRNFWFGHGFCLDDAPDEARLGALIAEGRRRFGALGAEKFVVTWEGCDTAAPMRPVAAHLTRASNLVLRYDGDLPADDPRVVDHDDAGWAEATALLMRQYPEHGDFAATQVADHRRAVERGIGRFVGVRDEGRLVATAGMYRSGTVARFAGPVTDPGARGRGLFSACARVLIRWAMADAPRDIVIVADAQEGPVRLYQRLGFVPVSRVDAVIVPI